jgi:hypothetical protein
VRYAWQLRRGSCDTRLKEGEIGMAARIFKLALFTTMVASLGVTAEAGWWNDNIITDFRDSVGRDFQRRNCWPDPFDCASKRDVESPFEIMVNNGWRRQNMLVDQHFDNTTNKLNAAGKAKVIWIITEAPLQHRTIFVHRSINPEVAVLRMDEVNQLAATISPQGALPAVLETSISPRGWPGQRVDIIGQRYNASTPDPRLPAVNTTSTE